MDPVRQVGNTLGIVHAAHGANLRCPLLPGLIGIGSVDSRGKLWQVEIVNE